MKLYLYSCGFYINILCSFVWFAIFNESVENVSGMHHLFYRLYFGNYLIHPEFFSFRVLSCLHYLNSFFYYLNNIICNQVLNKYWLQALTKYLRIVGVLVGNITAVLMLTFCPYLCCEFYRIQNTVCNIIIKKFVQFCINYFWRHDLMFQFNLI